MAAMTLDSQTKFLTSRFLIVARHRRLLLPSVLLTVPLRMTSRRVPSKGEALVVIPLHITYERTGAIAAYGVGLAG